MADPATITLAVKAAVTAAADRRTWKVLGVLITAILTPLIMAIDHGGGFVTIYAHCSKIFVAEGQIVKAGYIITQVGSTGRSTGEHLRFEVRVNGEKQNPRNYLP